MAAQSKAGNKTKFVTGSYPSQSDFIDFIDSYQDSLISGTNLRTVNGQSLLGSTDITIAGGSGPASTDALTEGTTNLYFTNPRAIAAPATGVSFVDLTAPTATSTILQFLGKLWGNILANATAIAANTSAIVLKMDDFVTPTAPPTTGNISVTFLANKTFPDTIQTGNIAFAIDMTGAVNNREETYSYLGDNSHSFTLPSNSQSINGIIPDNTKLNQIIFKNINGRIQHSVFKFPIPISLIPTISIALVNTSATPSVLELTLSYAVNITTAGWSITASGGAVSISSVLSGSGTTTPKFQLSRSIGSGETVTIGYDATTGNTVNSASTTDKLVTFTGRSVTIQTVTYLFYDDFATSSNTADINGRTPTTGGNWTIISGSTAVAGVVSGKIKQTTTGGVYCNYTSSVGTNNVDLRATIGVVGEGNDGIYPAYNDINNRVIVNATTGSVTQVIGGASAAGNLFAGSGTSVAGDIIRAVITGGSTPVLDVYRNSTKLNTTAISINTVTQGNKIGVSFYSASNSTDSISKITAQ